MPTGYAEVIYSDPNATFTDFALRCAHAFLTELRDSEPGTSIERTARPSNYYAEQLRIAEGRLKEAQSMTLEQARVLAEAAYEAERAARQKRQASSDELLLRYQSILAQVESWNPPTTKHENIKKFMVDQLQESMRWDCLGLREPEPVLLRPSEFIDKEIGKAKCEIALARDGHSKEVERTRQRNEWVAALLDSLGVEDKGGGYR